ncbi:RNB domain-containing ribonuclease [Arthrobacter sp. H20]|uniref:RNB domain-containing ribonuclease n=1 Tax=Arthrobacter sp. H20 TaxID=1267981 RepID=UPI00047B246E|nr:RNB domain-containing ribonuclease [Arthrobacter sp. H20]
MPYSHLDLSNRNSQLQLTRALHLLREELGLEAGFPPDVLAEARQAIAQHSRPTTDLTELGFITIDPPGSTDLDQAVHLERTTAGYRVWYAIADVPAFVTPGGAIDREARRRGQTVYAPDGRISLHPELISEDAASLLPGLVRPAYVWQFDLDETGAVQDMDLRRALIRSRAQLTYEQVQRDIDSGGAPENLVLLREVGLLRIELERLRGGASLSLPEQEIANDGDRYFILTSPPLPAEAWNAQISLLTGMAAAQLMIDGKIGVLRTMPPPDQESVARFRHQARVLGKPWPEDMAYGEFLRGLDTTEPRQLSLMHAAASLFRGAGYTAFDGDLPAAMSQAAIAAPYAHTTAPLRRLVDRFVLVICAALCENTEVPGWVRDALPELNSLMNSSNQLSSRMERGALDAVEAALLSNLVGQEFDAVVIAGSKPPNGNTPADYIPVGTIQLADPAVEARCEGSLLAGEKVRVRLVRADIAARITRFELINGAPTPGVSGTAAGAG